MFPKFMAQAARFASITDPQTRSSRTETAPSVPPLERAAPPREASAEIRAHIPEEHAVGEVVRDLGGYHEDLRTRCESAIGSLTALKDTALDIEAIFVEFSKISSELHHNRKELSEANRLLLVERGTSEDYRGRLASVQASLLQTQNQVDELMGRHDLLMQSHQDLQGLHATSQSNLRDAESRLKIMEPEFLSAKEMIAELSARTRGQESALQQAEQTIHELREELKLLKANLEFEVLERQKFGQMHDDVLAQFAEQQKALDEAQGDLRSTRDLLSQYEARHAVHVTERDALNVALETAKAMHEADAKNHVVKLEAVSARARLAEHLLEKTRGEQRDAFRDQTAHSDALRQIRRLETNLETVKQDLQEANRRCRDLEHNEQTLKERLNGQDAQLRDKQRSAEKSAEKIRSLQDLLDATQDRHAQQMSLIDEQVKKFTEELERERADRVYLEGALASARRDRVTLQAMLIKLKAANQDDMSNILGEIAAKLDEASLPAAAPSRSKPAAAPRSLRPNGRSSS